MAGRGWREEEWVTRICTAAPSCPVHFEETLPNSANLHSANNHQMLHLSTYTLVCDVGIVTPGLRSYLRGGV